MNLSIACQRFFLLYIFLYLFSWKLINKFDIMLNTAIVIKIFEFKNNLIYLKYLFGLNIEKFLFSL